MKLRAILVTMLCVLTMATATGQTKKYDRWRVENGVSLPTWAVKTNLLADLTTSMNLAFEARLGGHTSLDIMGQWNPWRYRGGRTQWRHWGVQPEFRYWTKETFRSHFFGLHAHYVFYNVGGLWNGPFTDYMHNYRFQGNLWGIGVSWGHRWNFSKRWGLEVTAGVGWSHKAYDRYVCAECGVKIDDKKKNYIGPTKLGVNLIFGGGEKVVPVAAPPVVPVAPMKLRYEPRFTPRFVTPEVEVVKVRAESGSAYLEFPVGKAEVVPSFRNNSVELEKIQALVSRVNSDPDTRVTGISLIGHASPEGSYNSNMSLSERRAVSLENYLERLNGFSPSLVHARGAGEDWETLGRLVDESDVAGKYGLLSIINGSDDYDTRDRQMMAISPEGYQQIKSEIYPRLRRTDYKLDFEVAPISIERGKEIMRTTPRNLSLNELFRIAETYEPGSEDFREVMEIAARAFPDSDVANNNAGAAALQRGDTVSAAQFLGKVANRDADWNNNMGILSYMQGNVEAASNYFAAAGSAATDNIGELKKHLESVK